MRGLGPLLLGAVFSASPSRPYAAFLVLGALYASIGVAGFYLPPEVERSKSELIKDGLAAAAAVHVATVAAAALTGHDENGAIRI